MFKAYILVTKAQDGSFHPDARFKDTGSYAESLEYGDVVKGMYQLWEYPGGRIYAIEPDRTVSADDYYSTPYNKKGVLWLPKLIDIGTDAKKVVSAYSQLSSPNVVQRSPVFSYAKTEFKNIADQLLQNKEIVKYELTDDSGIVCTFWRRPDNKVLIIRVLPSEEMFDRLFDNSYESMQTAYDKDDKAQKIQDLLSDVRIFMEERNYTEEIYENKGKPVYKKLVFPNGAIESKSLVFLGRLRKDEARKRITKPDLV